MKSPIDEHLPQTAGSFAGAFHSGEVNDWPLGTVTEIMAGRAGYETLRLVIPTLAQLSHQGRWLACIAPPYSLYAPSLAAHGVDLSRLLLIHSHGAANAQRAVERALRAGTYGVVLAWPKAIDEEAQQRLQLAAETGHSWCLLFRQSPADGKTSVMTRRHGTAAGKFQGKTIRQDGSPLLRQEPLRFD